MNIKSCLAFSIVLLLAIAPMVWGAESAGSVAGTIVGADKTGFDGVDVGIYTADDTKTPIATTQTTNGGKFSLNDIPAGKSYIVKAIKPKSILGLRAEQKDVAVEAGKTTDVGNMELKVPAK